MSTPTSKINKKMNQVDKNHLIDMKNSPMHCSKSIAQLQSAATSQTNWVWPGVTLAVLRSIPMASMGSVYLV